jgi:hypothetical protein
MRFRELNPEFLKIGADPAIYAPIESPQGADGVMFVCPKCFLEKGGPQGAHRVICWAPHVPLDRSPGPGRWSMTGNGFDDLSLVASSSSVKLTGGCAAHFFVTQGDVTFAPG